MPTFVRVTALNTQVAVNVDHIVYLQPQPNGGCVIHLDADEAKGNGTPHHARLIATEDLDVILGRIEAISAPAPRPARAVAGGR